MDAFLKFQYAKEFSILHKATSVSKTLCDEISSLRSLKTFVISTWKWIRSSK